MGRRSRGGRGGGKKSGKKSGRGLPSPPKVSGKLLSLLGRWGGSWPREPREEGFVVFGGGVEESSGRLLVLREFGG